MSRGIPSSKNEKRNSRNRYAIFFFDEETNVNNQRAEITIPHADNPGLESTDSEESTHAKEDKVKQENHRSKRKRDNPSKLEKRPCTFTERTEITEKAPGKADLPKVTAVQSQGLPT